MRANTVVVGAGGETGSYAMSWAGEHAAATGADLVLCYACSADWPLTSGDNLARLLELYDPTVGRAVAGLRTRLGGHRVSVRLAPGRPADLILATARTADLVTVGPPRPGSAGRRETAHRVAANATVPVVVVRHDGTTGPGPFAGHVVIGVDGSGASRVALECGFQEAALHHRPVAAVHVTTARREDYWFDDTVLSAQFTAEPAGLDLLAAETEPWHYRHPDVPVKRAVFAGRPAEGLLRAAAGSALLCVGDRGRSWPVRTLLGSVSDRAVDSADAPVAVVRKA